MIRKTTILLLIFLVMRVTTEVSSAAPWWDDFPRMVQDISVSEVTGHHGNLAFSAVGNDPSWGTFFQQNGSTAFAASTAAFQNAGIKQIGYFETYGETTCVVAELGPWDEINPTPVLHTFWSWSAYGGGTTRWLGAKDFFDNEDFARPYTRTHSRYGGVPMTYPDGTEATGYSGVATDPSHSRVYDAGCSKDILGRLFIIYLWSSGPTNGLVYVPKANKYAGHMSIGKDSACPLWTEYAYASTLQATDAGSDGIWTDNYGPFDSLGYNVAKHGFGDWSVARFRTYLSDNYDWIELLQLGVNNVATFDIRAHLKGIATSWGWDGSNLGQSVWNDSRWVDQPLWRAYLIFKRQAGTEALSNYYSAVKSAALVGGKPEFLVAGNDIPGFSFGWCRGDLDMVSTEFLMGNTSNGGASGFTAPPVGRYAPFYKLAREHAQSRFVNVWLYKDGYETALSHPELCNVMYYEMLSTHTLPMFQPLNARIVNPDAGATNTDFFQFAEQAALIYGDRVPVEDIGIYYSSSSILRQLTMNGFVNVNSQPHQFGFWGWGTALGELHYQYRAVSEWKLNAAMLNTLRLLVIPNADVLDPADVAVLTPWVNAGGRLIITGDSGKYLGESGNFEEAANWSVASLTNHANVVYLSDNIGMDYYLAYTGRPALLSQFSSVMNTALTGAIPAGVTETTASSRSGITLYEDENASRFFIDVNNFNINNSTYAVTGTGTVEIEVLSPSWLKKQRLKLSVVTPETNPPSVAFLAASSSDTLRVELSSVEYYAGIVIEKEPEWAAWQSTYFTPEEILTGLADIDGNPDGDGFTNEQEYIAGSDPRNNASVFDLQINANPGVGVALAFDSLSNRFYSLYYSTDLVHGVWSILETNIAGSGAVVFIDDTNVWSRAYYRVDAILPVD